MKGLSGAVAVLGTRHGKARVIVPILEGRLGLAIDVLDTLDTDRFGTFTREIPRAAGFRETARAKTLAAIDAHGRTAIGVASEGSFGPHPDVPFVAGGVELVLLVDRQADIELFGVDVTLETNFGAQEVGTVDEAHAFAARASFPSHGVIVMPVREGSPVVSDVVKGITEAAALEQAVRDALRTSGRAWVEADMRAHLNPTRMRSIERATIALAAAALSECPECGRPGYVVVDRVRGLPCSDCRCPTTRARAEVLGCAGCGRREERALSGPETAPPGECEWCNP
jgi:hypothetical protein